MSEHIRTYIGVGPSPEEAEYDLPHQRQLLDSSVFIPGGPDFPTVRGLDKPLSPKEIEFTLNVFDRINEQRAREE